MRNDTSGNIAVLLVAIVIIVIAVVGLDYVGSKEISVGSGIVLDKHFEPSHWTTNTNGDVSYESEQFHVIVKINGHVESIKCSSGQWGELNKGNHCQVKELKGTLMTHGYRL